MLRYEVLKILYQCYQAGTFVFHKSRKYFKIFLFIKQWLYVVAIVFNSMYFWKKNDVAKSNLSVYIF